jgi:cell filamentation protein
MDVAEFEALVAVQERYLMEVIGPGTRFDARLLCAMHRDWLGGIYEWAGRYRTVNVSKSGFSWPPASLVGRNMAAFESGLLAEHTPCPPEPVPATARRLAVVHGEFLLIHPFREGNGRMARWLADLMALQAGHGRPEFRFAGRGGPARRHRYLAGVSRAYVSDYGLLAELFEEALGAAGAAVSGRGDSSGSPRAPSK